MLLRSFPHYTRSRFEVPENLSIQNHNLKNFVHAFKSSWIEKSVCPQIICKWLHGEYEVVLRTSNLFSWWKKIQFCSTILAVEILPKTRNNYRNSWRNLARVENLNNENISLIYFTKIIPLFESIIASFILRLFRFPNENL